MTKLSTNGLDMPAEFPAAQYEAVHSAVTKRHGVHILYDHFGGAWNAIAYRYRAAADSGLLLSRLLATDGGAPPAEERYLQERALFEFFCSGFSVFESTLYGMFAVGAFVKPGAFLLTSPKDQQRVSPTATKDIYNKAFPGDPVSAALTNLFVDPAYQRWREIRNVLTHRAAPGRRIFVSIGNNEVPPVEWKLNNIVLDASLPTTELAGLTQTITDLLTSIQGFVMTNL